MELLPFPFFEFRVKWICRPQLFLPYFPISLIEPSRAPVKLAGCFDLQSLAGAAMRYEQLRQVTKYFPIRKLFSGPLAGPIEPLLGFYWGSIGGRGSYGKKIWGLQVCFILNKKGRGEQLFRNIKIHGGELVVVYFHF